MVNEVVAANLQNLAHPLAEPAGVENSRSFGQHSNLTHLAFALGQVPLWETSFYAGTFSEYDMWAIRRHVIDVDSKT